MAIQLRLDVAQLTDVGRKREHNEDNMAYVIPKDTQVMAMKGALFIVADGMGGHAAGEVASEIAVDTVSNAYYMDDNEDVSTPLLQAIKRANTAIYQRAAENMLRSGMGTTCVAAVLRGNMSYIANVGDSRAYLVRGNQVRQISQDHSWVAEQVRAGLLTEEQARTHAQRNVITRCLGTQPDVEVDVFRESLQEGDCLILCTDGLSGLVSDEELLRIVEQSVPQESVYHLVERANENGGPDNITAIVVRVHELGVEPPGVRNPVPVGGREIGQEDTGALNMLGAAATTPYTAGNVDGRVVSAPLHLSSGPLASPESITAPQPALGKPQRNRLFFPTLLLLFLIVVALAGGGFFYVVHNNDSQAVDAALTTAGQLITRAQGEVSSNPPQALKDLASAQNNLRDLQKAHTLDSNQTNRWNMLQSQMATQVKAAIGSYNTGAKIAVLPCHGTTSHSINTTSTNIQPSSIAAVHVQAGNGSTVLFALGPDGVVYKVTNQYGLLSVIAKTPSASAFAIASNGTQLFTLAEQLQGATNLPNPNGYSVNMYALDQTGKSLSKPVSAIIGQTFTTGGYAPTLITSWNKTIYVVLNIPNQNKARILAFTPDNKGHLVPAKPYDFSNSQPIMSVAAFADQFFLLLSNGAVQSLSLAGAFGNQSQSTFPTAVQVKSPIETPLPTSASHYTPAIVVPTVTPLLQSVSTSLLISTANTLSVGVVNTVSHLYIGDSTNHRVLDLQEAAPPPTGTGTGKSMTMQLVQQYVASQELNVVKSLAVDPLGTNLTILAQPGTTSPVHLLSVSTAAVQTGCGM